MTRDELRENIRCSLFDEQDTDDVMADVDRYVKSILQQTQCNTQFCDCGNELTEKELFYETCLKCEKTV